jgi:hypothetical protein
LAVTKKAVGDGKKLLTYLNSALIVLLGIDIFPRVPKKVKFCCPLLLMSLMQLLNKKPLLIIQILTLITLLSLLLQVLYVTNTTYSSLILTNAFTLTLITTIFTTTLFHAIGRQ